MAGARYGVVVTHRRAPLRSFNFLTAWKSFFSELAHDMEMVSMHEIQRERERGDKSNGESG